MSNDETRVLTKEEEAEARQEARTPDEFFSVLHEEFGFEVDVAASAENTKCKHFLTKETDALDFAQGLPWTNRALPLDIQNNMLLRRYFCNPGFSNVKPWAAACYVQTRAPGSVAVMLGLPSVSASWWRFCAQHAYEIRLLCPRVQYLPAPGIKFSSNSRECAMVVFRPTPVNWPGARIWTWRWRLSNKPLDNVC